MNWMLGDIGGNREGDAGDDGAGCGGRIGDWGDFAGFLDFSRPTSSCTRSTDKLIDSRPTLTSRL